MFWLSFKKDKMVSCRVPGCTNKADKNSDIIISYNDDNGIFNGWGIFKTMSSVSDDDSYRKPWNNQYSLTRHFQACSGTFSYIQSCSATYKDIKAYWAIFRLIQNSV